MNIVYNLWFNPDYKKNSEQCSLGKTLTEVLTSLFSVRDTTPSSNIVVYCNDHFLPDVQKLIEAKLVDSYCLLTGPLHGMIPKVEAFLAATEQYDQFLYLDTDTRAVVDLATMPEPSKFLTLSSFSHPDKRVPKSNPTMIFEKKLVLPMKGSKSYQPILNNLGYKCDYRACNCIYRWDRLQNKKQSERFKSEVQRAYKCIRSHPEKFKDAFNDEILTSGALRKLYPDGKTDAMLYSFMAEQRVHSFHRSEWILHRWANFYTLSEEKRAAYRGRAEALGLVYTW